jgi:kumamolisin
MFRRVQLTGSERKPVPNAVSVDTPDPNQIIDITLLLRRKKPLPPVGHRIDRRDLAQYGADPLDAKQVDAFAGQFDLTVTEVSLERRAVSLSGTFANIRAALGVDFDDVSVFQTPDGQRFRGRKGALYLPAHLDGVVVGVFGVDNRPQARTRLKHGRPNRHAAPQPGDAWYTPRQVAGLYQFPPNLTGAGQTIGVLEFGGGFRIFDVQTYFKNLGVMNPPPITSVSVDGAVNNDNSDSTGDDEEVMLDIEIIGAVAPGASIVVYFAPDDDRGFLDAITTAVHDASRTPSVLSLSWGSAESQWTEQGRNAVNEALQEAALVGVTVCVASGDDGSKDDVDDKKNHVDFPASSPYALACGGTRLESSNGAITNEIVWNDDTGASGGGVSEYFGIPDYQKNANVPLTSSSFAGRGVPDVAGDADPYTGFDVIVDGREKTIGGTSAVAPLWAGLIACINQASAMPIGFINPELYENSAAFRDITEGSNGAFKSGKGWDACTGLGSPIGTAILKVFNPGT